MVVSIPLKLFLSQGANARDGWVTGGPIFLDVMRYPLIRYRERVYATAGPWRIVS